MCAISGIKDIKGQGRVERTQLQSMIERLAHRGPDGYGYYIKDEIGLAHARLSIIDLEGGQQPIHNEDKTIWVIFNGEIFNYLELRQTLEQQGHRFYTQSDTEVIVHLYEQHGADYVHHLNGQFAIALWDSRQKVLLLSRDRVGIRPLFYTIHAGQLRFASEIKAIFTDPSLVRQLNPQALGHTFTYWSILPPDTLYVGIQTLPPGHTLTLQSGQIRLERYWDWTFPEEPLPEHSQDHYAEELRALLSDAVRLQRRADVPVGAYLSGGLDSAIITSLIKHHSDTPLRTFSIGFEHNEYDETPYQQELVKYLGTAHTAFTCPTAAIGNAFPATLWHTETTLLRTAPTPLMLLAQHVRDAGYKVVLTGEGADEVFAGYDLFKEAKIRRFWAKNPDSKVRPLIFERLYPYLKHSPTASAAYTQHFFKQGLEHQHQPYFAHIPRWNTTQRAWQFFSPELTAQLHGFDPYTNLSARLPAGIRRWQPLNQDQYLEAHTLLSGYLLCSQGDRVMLAHSVEGRVPFLDHRLIEFASRLPVRYKLKGLTEKYLLKESMKAYLPEKIRARTKQPYRAPDSQSFFQHGKPLDYVAALFSQANLKDSGLFDPKACAKLLEKGQKGRIIGFSDNMAFIGILSTLLIQELFIKGTPVSAFSATPSTPNPKNAYAATPHL